ncbi:LysR family transcriptional regulator [uncultured Oscillibacter sp.]|uniref:LysR family transcriptional regulator n=1 Tax=uncultured Oscillibacter sp. TaxID=876091 RepID=UPI0025F426CA|nr:LysR family transcriptional regulator [uncultured Oscillibacter sp.]
MTLLQLQYFRNLAHTLHYTRTAERLHISQPSLSYAISELEKELGAKLFQKDKHKVELTAYGQQFLPYVEKALILLDEGHDALKQMSGEARQTVRLGYFHSISASVIPALVEGFYAQESSSGIRFQFTEAPSRDIFSRIQSGDLDLGFSFHRGDWAQSVGVMRQPLYLAVPFGHRLAGEHAVTFLEFASEPQVMLEPASDLRTRLDQIFSQRGVVPTIAFEVRECNAALQYVGLKFGVAVLPYVPSMESEKVVVLPISDDGKEFSRIVNLTYSKERILSPAAILVRDYILGNFALEGSVNFDNI